MQEKASSQRRTQTRRRAAVPLRLSPCAALSGVVIICALGCQSSQPRQPTAAELSRLKLKCGEKSLNFSGQITAHFDEKAGHCYVEQMDSGTGEKLVYDVDTHRMLVETKEDTSGKTGIVANADGSFTQGSEAYGPAKDKMKELMQQDVK